MATYGKDYVPLPQSAETLDHPRGDHSFLNHGWRHYSTKVLAVFAILSGLGNLLCISRGFQNPGLRNLDFEKSLYAGLKRDVPIPYRDDTIFSPHNRTLSDAAWDSWVVDPGIVALPHDWVKAKMLPRAQKWPWDDDKGVYLLNGYHNLHCLVGFDCHCDLVKIDIISNLFASLLSTQQRAGQSPSLAEIRPKLWSIIFAALNLYARTRYATRTTLRATLDTPKTKSRESCKRECVEVGISWKLRREIIRHVTEILGETS